MYYDKELVFQFDYHFISQALHLWNGMLNILPKFVNLSVFVEKNDHMVLFTDQYRYFPTRNVVCPPTCLDWWGLIMVKSTMESAQSICFVFFISVDARHILRPDGTARFRTTLPLFIIVPLRISILSVGLWSNGKDFSSSFSWLTAAICVNCTFLYFESLGGPPCAVLRWPGTQKQWGREHWLSTSPLCSLHWVSSHRLTGLSCRRPKSRPVKTFKNGSI